jgi:hypothetical protein
MKHLVELFVDGSQVDYNLMLSFDLIIQINDGYVLTDCPAVTTSAPYKWVKARTSDGSTVFFPVWK